MYYLSYSYIVYLVVLYYAPFNSCEAKTYTIDMTYGEVWPKPKFQRSYDEYLKLEPNDFRFNVS